MENKKLYTAVTTTTPQLYKNLFRVYYRENWKIARIVCTFLSIPCILSAVWLYYKEAGLMWCIIALWAGAVLNIYPRQAYRRQARAMKDMSVTTHFDFYEDYETEKSAGASEKHLYSQMYKVIETGQYFYLFNTKDSISVIEKQNVVGGAEGLGSLLSSKTPYKLQK